MSLLQDLLPARFGDRIRVYSEPFLQNISQSMSNERCSFHDHEFGGCRDDSHALVLKLVAIGAILISGVCGVTIPLVGKRCRFLRSDSNLFVSAKAFAAGVILATGFVHMLPDATSSLTNSCLPKFPWSKFPFSGFIAMMAALASLLAEFVGTQYYESKQEKQTEVVPVESLDSVVESLIVPVETRECSGKVFGAEDDGAMHIVGMHAHRAHHGHSHPHEPGACEGYNQVKDPHGHSHSHSHSHSHGIGGLDEESDVRHTVVSQVLELGIISHSVIIGLSLGVSNSPCTIRPLVGALSFHQFFEGFALGGCISLARFKALRSTLMACFFAITTPLGISVGIGVSSVYNRNSPRALIVEGTLNSVSAGILVYMALVDLIAADFLSKRMRCNARLQFVSYIALLLGAMLMSSLAAWE